MRIDRVKFTAELTRQDMTQKRLSELAGISRATVNYIKSGKSCSDEIGIKIAAALNVPIEKLLEKITTNTGQGVEVKELRGRK